MSLKTEVHRTSSHLEWCVTAVTCEDSSEFAAALQEELNKKTSEGFSLAQMFTRGHKGDMILVHQRVTIQGVAPLDEGAPAQGVH